MYVSAAACKEKLLILQHIFLVFTLPCHSLAVCSLCRCSPPSLLAQQKLQHRPGETTDCSCHHTGPSLPSWDEKNNSQLKTCRSDQVKYKYLTAHYTLQTVQTSSPSGSLHHGAAHSEKSSSESEAAGSDTVCVGEQVLFDSSLLSLFFLGFFLRHFLALSLC